MSEVNMATPPGAGLTNVRAHIAPSNTPVARVGLVCIVVVETQC